MKDIIKIVLKEEVILYLIFGFITTIVNLGLFFFMNSILNWNENISNIIAIIISIIVAYLTNKDLVFHSGAKNTKEKLAEFIRFVIGRIFTILVEFFGGLVLFKLPIPNIITKFSLTVIVVILNFFISKFFAFKKRSDV